MCRPWWFSALSWPGPTPGFPAVPRCWLLVPRALRDRAGHPSRTPLSREGHPRAYGVGVRVMSSPRLRGLPGEPPPGAGSLEVVPAPAGEPVPLNTQCWVFSGNGPPPGIFGVWPVRSTPLWGRSARFPACLPVWDPHPPHVWRRNKGVLRACCGFRRSAARGADSCQRKLKMGKSSKMELTHPVMVASSAGTLRRCIKHIAEGGRSERDLRDERGGPFSPGIAQELDVSRNTVRRYLKSPEAMRPRPPRGSRLDPYAEHIDRRMGEGLENCRVLDRRFGPWGTRAATRRWCSVISKGSTLARAAHPVQPGLNGGTSLGQRNDPETTCLPRL